MWQYFVTPPHHSDVDSRLHSAILIQHRGDEILQDVENPVVEGLLRQHSYVMKNQLVASKAPY